MQEDSEVNVTFDEIIQIKKGWVIGFLIVRLFKAWSPDEKARRVELWDVVITLLLVYRSMFPFVIAVEIIDTWRTPLKVLDIVYFRWC